MVLSVIDISLVAAYFVVVLGIGLWAKRKETTTEYLIGGRKIGIVQTAASILAVLGGLVLVSQAALAFEFGFSSIWVWVGLALGFVALGLTSYRIKSIADKNNFITISNYIFKKFGYKNGMLASIILFVAYFSLLTGQFVAGGSLLAPFVGIPYTASVLVMGFGTFAYLLFGGFKSVIKTDFVQFIIMFVILLILLLTIDVGTYSPQQLDLASMGGASILGFLLIGFFLVFNGADIWQRIFASRNHSTARKSSFIAAGLFVVFGISITMVGIAAKNAFPDISPNDAFFYGMFQLVPTPLLGVSIIIILAAIMSTIDTELFYLASSVSKDFLWKKKLSNEQLKRTIQRSMAVLILVSMLIAIVVSDILFLLSSLLSLSLAVAPIIFGSLFWRIKNSAAFLSMIAGVLAFVVVFAAGILTPETAVVPLPFAILFLFIGQFASGKQEKQYANN